MKDKHIITQLLSALKNGGVNLLIAEHSVDLTKTITEKIKALISNSQMAIFLLTENGFNSNFVHQEIGYIENSKIPRLYIVDKNIKDKLTGFTYGKDFVLFDEEKPDEAIKKVREVISKYMIRLFEARRKAEQKRIEEDEKKAALAVVGIFATMLIGAAIFADKNVK